jgi:glycosyltransferase involved in cell wall biosynthesis
MLRLMELTEDERRAMGERGREHVRSHYSLTRVVQQWEGLYHDVLARRARAPLSAKPS